MYLKTLFCCLLVVFSFCSKVDADEVPVVFWNIKGEALSIKPVVALGKDDRVFDDSLKNFMNEKDNANILVFSMNKLSSEDFSSADKYTSRNSTLQNFQNFLDSRPYMFMSAVRDPLRKLHEKHCGVQEIVVDQNIDENMLQSISLAFKQSCIVILHITDDKVFGAKEPDKEEVEKIFLPAFPNSPKNVVGIFTSDKSSWVGTSNEHHIMRNLLQVEDADKNFINITGCIYAYLTNASVQVGKGNNTFQLSMPADTSGSSCDNGTATLKLSFKGSGAVSKADVRLEFTKKMGDWVTDGSVTLTGENIPTGELPIYSNFIEAPLKYSFNCGKLQLKTKNKTNVVVTLNNFQVQPFPVGDKFSSSFDCVPFFTIPIWMGIFVSLLFIVIINWGVYALFSVHTMDRFDDPKGKTISVATSGD